MTTARNKDHKDVINKSWKSEKRRRKKTAKKTKKWTPRQEVKNKIKQTIWNQNRRTETKFLYKSNAKIGRQRNSKQQKKKN